MKTTPSNIRILKLSLLAVLLCGVFIRYDQKHPVSARKYLPSTQSEPIVTAAKPQEAKPAPVSEKQSNSVITKQISTTRNITQKRYFLLDAPNDTYYNSTWYLGNIHAPQAWDVANDSSGVIVADIDTGFALQHQDLVDQWQLNPGESGDGKESNGLDDDNNGYTDDYRGWDFVNNDNQPQTGTLNASGEGVTHGTETAGLVGATTNNSLGIASVSRGARILPLQVIDDNGNGFSDDVAQAIIYAIDQGAKVINMSLGTNGDDPLVRAAIDLAYEHNVVVVAAAGNCGNSSIGACAGEVSGYVTFPANYNRVIAVGATDVNNNRASFSSYGERLDIMAPGSGTLISTSWSAGNQSTLYASSLYGTSFASPIVASTVALIRSIRPESTVDDVRALLMGSSTKLSTMGNAFYTQAYGHGLVDVAQSIQIATDLNVTEQTEPALRQAGGSITEHSFITNDVLGSACQTMAITWCTLWLRNEDANYERFLPYTKTDVDGQAGWNYSEVVLYKGAWESRARQGDSMSTTPYVLYKK